MSTSAGRGYAATAVSGIAWQGIAGLAIRLIRSLVFLVLARLIVPEAFGVIALATVFTTVLRHLTGGGFSQALIQLPKVTKSHLDTAFHVSIAVGAVLTVALALLAERVADWMDEPELRLVLLGLSAMPLLAGVSSVPEGLLAREMKFRALSVRHLVAASVSTAVALVLALAGAGVWALVAQTLAETVVSCTMLWIAVRRSYTPGTQFSKSAFRDLSGYGFKVVAYDLTHLVSTRADDFLIGAVLGARALGLYSVAYRLLTILQETLQGVAAGVAFPLYARLQDDAERLARGFQRASRLNLAIAGPIFLYVAMAAPQVVPVALGEQWDAAAPVMTALALSGVATVVMEMNTTLLNAKGKVGRVLALSLAGSALNLLGFALAVRFGIFWVAVAFTVRAYLLVPVSIRMVAPHLGGSRHVIGAYVPILASLAVPLLAGAASWALAPMVGDLGALIVTGPAGVLLYLLCLRLLARDCFDDLTMVSNRLLRRRRSVPEQG